MLTTGIFHINDRTPINLISIIFIYLFTFMTTREIAHANKELLSRPLFFQMNSKLECGYSNNGRHGM